MAPNARTPYICAMRTPCINVCVIDPVSEVCQGCLRTLDEIADWASYSDAERDQVMATLSQRAPADTGAET